MAGTARLTKNLKALPNVSRLISLVERCETRHEFSDGMGVFFGRPGLGKTSAAACAAVLRECLHLTAEPFTTPKSLLVMLAENLGAKLPRRAAMSDIFRLVVAALVDTGRTLILDEADYLLREDVINTVRQLHDRSKVPVILMGEEELPQDLLRWARVHSRVLDWVGAENAVLADIDLLAPLHLIDVAIDDEMKAALLAGSGHNHRYICKNMVRIREAALARGLRLMTRADWADRPLSGGEAPKPRSIPAHAQRPSRLRRFA